MFLAASPYFQHRFRASTVLLSAFPSALISVSCITNLVAMLLLTHLQSQANYPNRILLSLTFNIVAFTLLALSTVLFRSVSPALYFGFLMAIVFTASLATGLCQNGLFAYVSGFGVGEYTQAIMTGQAVAGVLPCIAQIVSVLSIAPPSPSDDKDSPIPEESGKSAFAYFLTATAVSTGALFAFMLLLRRHPDSGTDTKTPLRDNTDEPPVRRVVDLWTLFRKLRYLASAVFITFTITMFFPVFTQQITSTRPASTAPRILQPACFIPLAFLFWNTGDLAGRLLTLIPSLTLVRWPKIVFVASLARALFIPLYFLCNVHGNGAVVASDAFYLVAVQLLFGLTNGYLGSTCMMGAGEWVDVEEREAAGGFMGLMLVGGLTVGSLLSFLVA
jgi:equilibrative nucleoside transporter 1/2/3